MSKATPPKGKTTGAAKSAGTPKSNARMAPTGTMPKSITNGAVPSGAKNIAKSTKPAESGASKASKATPRQTATQRSSARLTRQEQQEQRRRERHRAAQMAQRWRLLKRFGLFAGGALIAALIIYLIVNAYHPGAPTNPQTNAHNLITGTGTYTTPANGSPRDGMTCLGMEGSVIHIHMYLAIYVNGKQVQVPPDTGIVNGGSCFYPLHVHSDPGDENIIHEESPINATYTLGAFFDVWGERLSSTQVMSYKADATHTLTFITFDGNGHKTIVKGNPLDITFSEHETIYILYNSPNVTPTPFTNFLPGE